MSLSHLRRCARSLILHWNPLFTLSSRNPISSFYPDRTRPWVSYTKYILRQHRYSVSVGSSSALFSTSFLSCSVLRPFCSEVRRITQTLMDYSIPDEAALFLLYHTPISYKKYNSSVFRHLLNAAKSCIPFKWKQTTPLLHGAVEPQGWGYQADWELRPLISSSSRHPPGLLVQLA